MNHENCLNKRIYDISKTKEILEIGLLSLLIFLVPLIIPRLINIIFGSSSFLANNSQYVVGTIVNASLIIGAINIKGWKKIISLVTLPSLSAITSGLVLKSASIFTIYMIPFIWIGNFLLIYLIKYLYVKKNKNYIFGLTLAILTKCTIIITGFNILDKSNIFPSKISTVLFGAMGINQFITAIFGTVLAFSVMKTIYEPLTKK